MYKKILKKSLTNKFKYYYYTCNNIIRVSIQKSQVDSKTSKTDQKKRRELLIFLSKYPENYTKNTNMENEYDPLLINADLLKNIPLRKSK